MKYSILLITLALISPTSYAEPTKAKAEKWRTEFRAAKDKVFDALFITKTSEHQNLTKKLNQLNAQAEKLFGKPMTSELASCTIAAIDLKGVWQHIAEIGRTGQLDKMVPSGIAYAAWNGGEHYPECLDAMDKLK